MFNISCSSTSICSHHISHFHCCCLCPNEGRTTWIIFSGAIIVGQFAERYMYVAFIFKRSNKNGYSRSSTDRRFKNTLYYDAPIRRHIWTCDGTSNLMEELFRSDPETESEQRQRQQLWIQEMIWMHQNIQLPVTSWDELLSLNEILKDSSRRHDLVLISIYIIKLY